MPPHESLVTLSIISLATAGVVIRPFRLPEAIWATAGAAALVLCNFLTAGEAWRGVVKGLDVYLFLIGMMLSAELARNKACSTISRRLRSSMPVARRRGCFFWSMPSELSSLSFSPMMPQSSC
jgi:hypothetical protein